jgi:3-deoxy-manno-octulosonate cytidylyltransferase (CMP-KDO synthetase)|tara:strand:+ start:70 stop:837 length:768 start_codon:yes stop_codon:yes gene_type:complete
LNIEFTVVIPARFASQRLPGKPLRDVDGKPLIQRTFEAAAQSGANAVVVATDDEAIARVVDSFGGTACMTDSTHASGTDRVAEAVQKIGLPADAIVVNLQGDEPGMPSDLIRQVAQELVEHSSASVATACCHLEHPEEYDNSDVVKVVRDCDRYALYFSRAPVPFYRAHQPNTDDRVAWSEIRRHIGIYAYHCSYLATFTARTMAPPEAAEKLEQLRALWYGDRIIVCDAATRPGPGVDTLDDLERIIHEYQSLR